jgi:8-oxo-dGTP pyrophosphatase MutT (NUDIX family)
MILPWNILNSEALAEYRIFKLRMDRKVSPRNGMAHDFFVLDTVPWVNVVALTPARELIMIEQFRHGTNTVELEIPGGTMDAHDASPVAAGLRELREETGYEGHNPRLLGQVFPNPAIMSNTCYTVLVDNCELKHDLQLDTGEDLVTRLVPVAEVPRLVAEEKIRHSLVVVALYYLELWDRGIKPVP